MAVLGVLSVTLEVPDIGPGVRFYSDAGLCGSVDGHVARFRCAEGGTDCIVLIGGKNRKRCHHIALRADDLDGMAARIAAHGGALVAAPDGFDANGLWCRDPHGMLLHLVEHAAEPDLEPADPFEINAPGRLVRKNRSAMSPIRACPPCRPLRLGHVLLFSPNVPASVAFMTDGLGMGLADRAQDVIAFCCARRASDHHVVAFAKSSGIGFHHASFQVADPDAVGRCGQALLAATGGQGWGFGRHTIGSNFFHYIQDPWGSWLEYYSDMDYIEDYHFWAPANYAMEDSLANWGPSVPDDFVCNYESGEEGFFK